jgi:hypothetical protein
MNGRIGWPTAVFGTIKTLGERTSPLAGSAVQFKGDATRTSVNRIPNMAVELSSQNSFTSKRPVFTPGRYNHLVWIPFWTYVFRNAYHNSIHLPFRLFGARC